MIANGVRTTPITEIPPPLTKTTLWKPPTLHKDRLWTGAVCVPCLTCAILSNFLLINIVFFFGVLATQNRLKLPKSLELPEKGPGKLPKIA